MKFADFLFLMFGVVLNAAAQLGLKVATAESGPIRGDAVQMLASAQKLLLVPAFWLALAAYALYAINATQFLLKLRAARRQERHA